MKRAQSSQQTQQSQVFFQTQGKLSKKCGVCALNNLLGNQIFSTDRLDQVCKLLSDSFINPYKSIFGGDYDVSVLIYALNFLEKEVKWIKPSDSISEEIKNPNCIGFLFNMVLGKRNILMKIVDYSNRHWTCARKCEQGIFYLDSAQNSARNFENEQCLAKQMQKMREDGVVILSIRAREYPSIILDEQAHSHSMYDTIKSTKKQIEEFIEHESKLHGNEE